MWRNFPLLHDEENYLFIYPNDVVLAFLLTGEMLSYCSLETAISYTFHNKGPLSDLEFDFCNSFTNSFSLNNSHVKFHEKYSATF